MNKSLGVVSSLLTLIIVPKDKNLINGTNIEVNISTTNQAGTPGSGSTIDYTAGFYDGILNITMKIIGLNDTYYKGDIASGIIKTYNWNENQSIDVGNISLNIYKFENNNLTFIDGFLIKEESIGTYLFNYTNQEKGIFIYEFDNIYVKKQITIQVLGKNFIEDIKTDLKDKITSLKGNKTDLEFIIMAGIISVLVLFFFVLLAYAIAKTFKKAKKEISA